MYAQTVAYGLFAARCNHPAGKEFKRTEAAAEIPKTNPFLRRIFETIAGTELNDEPYAGFVDELVQLLAMADVAEILKNFGKRTKQEDPVVHFYETFLASYDPELRERRGVYYTPEPVVLYIVRSIDKLLSASFKMSAGLSDTTTVTYERQIEKDKKEQVTVPKVLVLDPACGTGTFLYYVIDHIREGFMAKGNAGLWSSYIENQLLTRLFGFELLMAPYAVAHFKLALQLAGQDLSDKLREKWGYKFSKESRLSVYLTNTLKEIEHTPPALYGPLRVITEEAQAANHVKKAMPILVVLGNPPYSGHSSNRSWKIDARGKRVPTFVGRLVRDYYSVDGRPLGERNPKWLQDDYVKFIRWGQWRIDRSGAGVLALITNHGYLDNPTFRGMRQSLVNSFTDIFIFNLHGNSKKKETTPDGSFDGNVFDIRQGVAIGLFVKQPDRKPPAVVHHADLFGTREHKYKQLLAQDVETTAWNNILPKSPLYLFVPVDTKREAEYHRGVQVSELFGVQSNGIVTARDSLTIHFTETETWRVVRDFSKLDSKDAKESYGIHDSKEWTIKAAQADVQRSGPKRQKIVPIQYRPFDRRYTYYTGEIGFIGRPRPEVMHHLLNHDNVALHICRQVVTDIYQHALCTRRITDDCYVSNVTRERGFTMPLYITPSGFDFCPWPQNANGQVPNFNPAIISQIENQLNASLTAYGSSKANTFTPEQLFGYVYAILYSEGFRDRYSQFLKLDFPKIPITSDLQLFKELAAHGYRLVQLHTLRIPDLSIDDVSYPVPGPHLGATGHPTFTDADPATGKPLSKSRVYINGEQYFEGVPSEAWEFEIGSYQVCEKWLKDRKGNNFTFEELTTYRTIVASIRATIRLMDEIDDLIPRWPLP